MSNAFCVRGLELLSAMLAAGGRVADAASVGLEAKELKEAMMAHMWNGSAFCDGVCEEVSGGKRR